MEVRFAWRAGVTDDELVILTRSHGGEPFYHDACGFVPTRAGLLYLPDLEPAYPP